MKYIPCTVEEEKEMLKSIGIKSFDELIDMIPKNIKLNNSYGISEPMSEIELLSHIEKISDKALKVSSKFVSENNLNNLNKEKATLIWCCKEAIFKLHQKGNVDFKEDIKLTPFSLQNKGIVNAEFNSEIFRLHYTKLNSHFLVYVCK